MACARRYIRCSWRTACFELDTKCAGEAWPSPILGTKVAFEALAKRHCVTVKLLLRTMHSESTELIDPHPAAEDCHNRISTDDLL